MKINGFFNTVPSKPMGCWAVARGPHANLCMLCIACFLMFKRWFCWKYKYNKYMFNFIEIYSFIPVSGCVGMGPVHCFAVKTSLIIQVCIERGNFHKCESIFSEWSTMVLL